MKSAKTDICAVDRRKYLRELWPNHYSLPMVHRGIVLYEEGLDGSLTGVYANEHGPFAGRIFNEIARKRGNTAGLVGTYDCAYFEPGTARRNALRRAVLTISQPTTGQNVYEFVWSSGRGGRQLFKGIGYRMNAQQIAVHYTGRG